MTIEGNEYLSFEGNKYLSFEQSQILKVFMLRMHIPFDWYPSK